VRESKTSMLPLNLLLIASFFLPWHKTTAPVVYSCNIVDSLMTKYEDGDQTVHGVLNYALGYCQRGGFLREPQTSFILRHGEVLYDITPLWVVLCVQTVLAAFIPEKLTMPMFSISMAALSYIIHAFKVPGGWHEMSLGFWIGALACTIFWIKQIVGVLFCVKS